MKIKNTVRRTKGERIVRGFVFTVFCLYCAIMFVPLFYLFLTSFKTQYEYMVNTPFSAPAVLRFSNYVDAFSKLQVNGIGIPMMFVNSLWYAGGMVLGNMMVCAMFAYVLARYPFPGSRIVYNALLLMMSLPIVGTGAATYRLYANLGLIDSPLIVIANWGCMGYNTIFLERYFKYVAKDYAEAAQIDGAGHAKTFFVIIFPQIINIVSALVLTQFIGYWNSTSDQLMFLKNLPNLATGLYLYEAKMIREVNIPLYFAGLVLSFIPIVVLFCAFQNTIMERVSGGGIKG